ncbi:MAG: SPFH domain-containing protein, partial [Cetobacterium sp.]
EGEAEAILSIQKANAEAIRLIKEAAPDKSVLMIKGMEAFEKVANGQATKIIIPSELQNIVTLSELFHESKK